jgi:hypothetical protein
MAKEGHSMACKNNFSNEGQINHTPVKTHVAEFSSEGIFTWIQQNQAKGTIKNHVEGYILK